MRPPLVEKALSSGLGGEDGDARGRLLHVLASQRGRVRAAHLGWDAGAAWVAAGLAPGIPLVVVEPDPDAAAAAETFFAADGDVRVLCGRWDELLPAEAPFDLLVTRLADARLAELLAPGGTLISDAPAPEHPRLACASVGLSSRETVIVGTLQPT